MSFLNPLILLFAPVAYILAASLSLMQFSVLLNALTGALRSVERTPALEAFAPVLKAFVRYQEQIFGPAYKYTPNPTQVMLVALMLAIIVHTRRG